VIVRNLNIVRIALSKPEANALLVADGNRVLTSPVTPELVETIPRGGCEGVPVREGFDHPRTI